MSDMPDLFPDLLGLNGQIQIDDENKESQNPKVALDKEATEGTNDKAKPPAATPDKEESRLSQLTSKEPNQSVVGEDTAADVPVVEGKDPPTAPVTYLVDADAPVVEDVEQYIYANETTAEKGNDDSSDAINMKNEAHKVEPVQEKTGTHEKTLEDDSNLQSFPMKENPKSPQTVSHKSQMGQENETEEFKTNGSDDISPQITESEDKDLSAEQEPTQLLSSEGNSGDQTSQPLQPQQQQKRTEPLSEDLNNTALSQTTSHEEKDNEQDVQSGAEEKHDMHQKPEVLEEDLHQNPSAPFYNSIATTEIVHSLFGPSVGSCRGDFSCQHNHVRGRLYASTHAVLFYSNLFGFEKRLCLAFTNIREIQLFRTTSIQISVRSVEDGNNNFDIYIFKAFSERQEVLRLLLDLWRKGAASSIGTAPPTTYGTPQRTRRQEEPAANEAPTSSPLPQGEGVGDGTSSQHPPSILRATTALPISPISNIGNFIPRRPFTRRANSVPSDPKRSASPASTEATTEDVDFDYKSTTDDDWKHYAGAWEQAKKPVDPCVTDKIIQALRLPCSLDTFYDLFLAQDAPHSLDVFQGSDAIKDLDIEVTSWELDSLVAESVPVDTLTRTISFRHPVQSLGVGPSHAPSVKTQRLRRYHGHGIWLHTSTTVEGLPGTDCFVVEEMWLVEKSNLPGNLPEVTLSTIHGIRWKKFSFLKSIIQSSTRAGTEETMNAYQTFVVAAVEDHNAKNPPLVETERRRAKSVQPQQEKEGLPKSILDNNLQPSVFDWKPAMPLLVGMLVVTLILFSLLLVIIYQLRATLKTNEMLQQEMHLLRLDHEKLLALLMESQQVRQRS